MNQQVGNRAISVPHLPVDYFNASLDVQSCSRGCCLVDCCPGNLSVLFRSPTRDSEPADELPLVVDYRDSPTHKKEPSVRVIKVWERLSNL